MSRGFRDVGIFQIEDNMFADATHMHYAGMFEHGCDLDSSGLKHLRLVAQPDGFDDVARDAFVQAASNGFYLRKFGHWK